MSISAPYASCDETTMVAGRQWLCSRPRNHASPHRAFQDSEVIAEWARADQPAEEQSADQQPDLLTLLDELVGGAR